MSLAIQKYQEGGSPEIRLLKRGNDYVDADTFIRNSEVGFNSFLEGLGLNEKAQQQVRSAYQDVINKINDDPNSFAGRLGGGFTNTVNITNSPDQKGFDTYGLVATYLGSVLRGMQAYRKPEEKKESSKTKYTRDGVIITPELQAAILGKNPESFMMLDNDSYDEDTGYRGTANRYAHIIKELRDRQKAILDNLEYDNEEDKQHALSRYNNMITILENDNPNDDYFALEQFGFTNPDAFFTTGKDVSYTPLTQEEQAQKVAVARAQHFDDWMNSNHPLYTGQLLNPITIGTDRGYLSNDELAQFRRQVGTLSNNDLQDWFYQYINDPTADQFWDPRFLQLFGGKQPLYGYLTSNQVAQEFLNQMITNQLMTQITGSNTYYIPDTLKTYDNGASTVFMYNPGKRQLQLVDTQDIPNFRQQYEQEYEASNPDYSNYEGNYKFKDRYSHRYKDGGILKGYTGLDTSNITLPSVNGNPLQSTMNSYYAQMHSENPFNLNEIANWAKLNYGIDPSAFENNTSLAKTLLTGWNGQRNDARTDKIGGREVKDPTIGEAYRLQRNYINSGNMISDVRSAYNNWLQSNPDGTYEDFVNYYNNVVQRGRDSSLTKQTKGYNSKDFQSLYDDYNWLYSSSANNYDVSKGLLGSQGNLSSVLGTTMFNRNMLAFANDDDSKDLRLGTFTDDDQNTQFWINNEGKLELRKPAPVELSQEVVVTPQKVTDLNEVGINKNNNNTSGNSSIPNGKSDFAKYLALGLERLTDITKTNNEIYETTDKNLIGRRYDPYWTWSPKIDDNDGRTYSENLGTQYVDRVGKADNTSDIDRFNSAMYDAYKAKNNLSTQSNLKSSEIIQKSALEGLKHQWKNTELNTTIANQNRDFDVDLLWKKGQLKAANLKSNQQARDAFARELQQLALDNYSWKTGINRYLQEQDIIDERNYYNQLDNFSTNASYNYQKELDQISQLMSDYTTSTGKDVRTAPWYEEIAGRRYELLRRQMNDQLLAHGRRKGYGTEDFFQRSRYIPWNYSYYMRNGGLLNKKNY